MTHMKSWHEIWTEAWAEYHNTLPKEGEAYRGPFWNDPQPSEYTRKYWNMRLAESESEEGYKACDEVYNEVYNKDQKRRSMRWYCTLNKGHRGPHCAGSGLLACYVWDQDFDEEHYNVWIGRLR